MDPDLEFTPGHVYQNDARFSYLILGRSHEIAVYFIPETKTIDRSTYAFTRPVNDRWHHVSDCRCHGSHR